MITRVLPCADDVAELYAFVPTTLRCCTLANVRIIAPKFAPLGQVGHLNDLMRSGNLVVFWKQFELFGATAEVMEAG